MKTKAKRNGGPPFIAIPVSMLESKAYQKLQPYAAKMLPYFLGKVKIFFKEPEYYKTVFSFPYSEGIRLGCAKRTFLRVINNLMSHGFIDPIRKGGLRGDNKSMSSFKLSERWKKHGTCEFKEIRWDTFGESQIYRQVHICHPFVAKSEPREEQKTA